jgi:class 3 adenylate cyclase
MTDGALRTDAAPTATPTSALLTFLLADIWGYTRFAAEHGDAAAGRLSERFLTLCRDVITRHGGEVFGSAGDQGLAAFPSTLAALRAVLGLRARLAEEQEARPDLPPNVGIGLDSGEAIRVGSDYRSNAINLAARLCSIAGPGEISASETVLAPCRMGSIQPDYHSAIA